MPRPRYKLYYHVIDESPSNGLWWGRGQWVAQHQASSSACRCRTMRQALRAARHLISLGGQPVIQRWVRNKDFTDEIRLRVKTIPVPERTSFSDKMAAISKHAEKFAAYTDDDWRKIERERITEGVEDKTNLAFWYPKLVAAGIPTPRTEIIHVEDPEGELFKLEELNSSPVLDDLCERIMSAIMVAGFSAPVFLRTGHFSGKHNWSRCCHLHAIDVTTIRSHVFNIIDMSGIVDILGLPIHTWVVREMLDVRPLFRMRAYGYMPFVPEVRCFAEGGQVKYMVPYWPDGAIEQGEPTSPDWRELVADANRDIEERRNRICYLAERASRAVQGRWSIDVLFGAGNSLWVTDMAEAEKSYGYDPGKFGTKPVDKIDAD